jgi:hypothetical protein
VPLLHVVDLEKGFDSAQWLQGATVEATCGGVDGSRGGDRGDGRSCDLHVNKVIGDVIDTVVRV